MSLVGSELNLVLEFDGIADEEGQQQSQENENEPQPSADIVEESSDRGDHGHEPLTPQTGIENFFMGDLNTQHISASALAQEIHQRHKPILQAPSSPSGDLNDFRTANSNLSDTCDDTTLENREDSPFVTDALSRELDFSETKAEPESTSRNMATTTTTAPTVAAIPPSDEVVAEDETMHIDPAEKIYDTAKGIWGWGKGVIIFSPFLGIAEGIAGKALETAGTSLEDVDSAFQGKLQGLDDGILNPAIQVVVKTVLGAAHKTEEFVKPIIITVLKPIDFMLKKESENAETAEAAPEVTPDSSTPMN